MLIPKPIMISIPQMLHVYDIYIYLHEWLKFYGINVGNIFLCPMYIVQIWGVPAIPHKKRMINNDLGEKNSQRCRRRISERGRLRGLAESSLLGKGVLDVDQKTRHGEGIWGWTLKWWGPWVFVTKKRSALGVWIWEYHQFKETTIWCVFFGWGGGN